MTPLLDHDNQTQFEIIKIINQRVLSFCKQTSFAWSKNPQSLCLAVNKYYFDLAVKNPNISGVIASPEAIRHLQNDISKAIVVSEKADELFYYLHNMAIHEIVTNNPKNLETQENLEKTFISSSATIDPTVKLGNNIWIGENVIIHPGCMILDNCTIKRDCVLHPNVTIGTEGFFSKHVLGKKTQIRHFGGVKLGENCIIHTGTNISRSVNYNENTVLADNVHVGIHTNIGHDCQIGSNSDISAKVILAGRVRVGEGCWIGANVAIANALSIGNGCKIMIGSVVITDVPDNTTVSGNFALNHSTHLRNYLRNKRL